VIDGKELERDLNIPSVRLINDFVAIGYGLLTLKPNETEVIQKGHIVPNAPIACVGAGTGLGECFLTWQNGGYETWGTEGGHTDFTPRTSIEDELLRFLRNKFSGRVSLERVLSGPGLVNTYEFLTTKFPDKVRDPELKYEILTTKEGAAVISENCAKDLLCQQAMDIMMSVYGCEAGNVGLKYLAHGGIYITGGIAPKNKAHLLDSNSPFLAAFRDKGRLSKVVSQMHVAIVMAEDIGLRGARYVAQGLLNASSVTPVITDRSHAPHENLANPASFLIPILVGVGSLLVGAFLGKSLFKNL